MIIILGSFILCFYKQDVSDNISDWASFGAYVGGCFGFISVIIMYMVFREQSKMAYKSQFEAVFFDMLRTLREIWSAGLEIKSTQLCDKISEHFNVDFGANEVERTDVKKVMSYYMAVHKKDSSINHYFRYLYHIIKYVVTNNNLDDNIKTDYISL
ncbi:MAG: putative phage abortive infection protein, partial [Anaeroplasmataceae bacterium]|nr:putative phage abortive infection protein [Anaeroplasmataceae bacterium]